MASIGPYVDQSPDEPLLPAHHKSCANRPTQAMDENPDGRNTVAYSRSASLHKKGGGGMVWDRVLPFKESLLQPLTENTVQLLLLLYYYYWNVINLVREHSKNQQTSCDKCQPF